LLFLLVLRGADSEDDLSKYVFVLSFKKYAPKLQKIIETKLQKAKKVAKRDKISLSKGQNSIKKTNYKLRISFTLLKHYPSSTQAIDILLPYSRIKQDAT